MKNFNKIKFLQKSLVASCVMVVGSASAAVPASVSTALGDAATDVATVGGLAIVAVLAGVVFKYMRRAF